jgi:hypothetical protein
MTKRFMPVWRVYRIQGRKAIVVATVKLPDPDSALQQVLDRLGITEPQEKESFFVRQDD